MTTPMQISRNRVEELDKMGLFYCNEIPWRCSNPRCRDCSTAASDIVNASGAGVSPCGTSFTLASWCYHAERPQWFTDLYGNYPGTFISREAAHNVQVLAFHGNNWGMNSDSSGDGHVEYGCGEGPLTWGAHSHATGCGYRTNGLDETFLEFFAVPPHFIPWMIPAPPIDWEKLQILIDWKKRVSARRQLDNKKKRKIGTLERGDRNGDVLIAQQLLYKLHYLKSTPGEAYGLKMALAVRDYKRRNGWPKSQQTGSKFGAAIANSILR